MPRPVRVLLWAVAFVGAAGVGAFVAAHSNPFPPDVRDGGAPSVGLTSGPATPTAQVWKGTIESRSAHRLYVGGSCETDWRGALLLTVHDDAGVRGVGTVRRVGALRCDFPTDQAQIARYRLVVTGTATSHGFELHLTQAAATPSSGADEYGGFLHTVLQSGARSLLEIPATGPLAASGTVAIRLVDPEGRGTFVSRTRVGLGCDRRCGG